MCAKPTGDIYPTGYSSSPEVPLRVSDKGSLLVFVAGNLNTGTQGLSVHSSPRFYFPLFLGLNCPETWLLLLLASWV